VSQSKQHGPKGPPTDLIEFKEPLPALNSNVWLRKDMYR